MSDIDLIVKNLKKKKKMTVSKQKPVKAESRPKLIYFLSKVMILVILFIGALIYTKTSEKNKLALYEIMFEKSISFGSLNGIYNKYLGGILPFDNLFKGTETVFKENFEYKEAAKYKDGVKLSVTKKYLVPIQESGIVVFIGDKDEYKNTIIIQQVNGIDMWYSNIENLNIKIYDYVEKGTLLGETIDENLYLVYKKEGKVLDYKKYLK